MRPNVSKGVLLLMRNMASSHLEGARTSIDASPRFPLPFACRWAALTPEKLVQRVSFGDGARIQVTGQRSSQARGRGMQEIGRRLCVWGGGALIGSVLVACSSMPFGGVTAESSPEAKQAAVLERAKARWQAVSEGNVEKAYSFLSSGSKAGASQQAYGLRVAKLKDLQNVEVQGAVCGTETCKVKIQVVTDHKWMKGLVSGGEESWVLENGQYWYVWRP